MKTIVCEQPNQFVAKHTERPVPKPGEALIQIQRIGLCGTDYHAYRGNQPFFEYPRVLGHELAGEIVWVPEGSDEFTVGELVAVIPYMACGSCIACRRSKTNCCTAMSVLGVHTDGGMREIISVPLKFIIKADGLTPDQAALVEPLSIGAHAVRRSGVQAGEYVVVIGAGPIGLGVMKFAKLAGAQVIAMDLNEERLAYCKTWVPVDYTVQAGNQALEQILAITGGDLPTVVLDATGHPGSMMNAFQYVSHGGVLVYVGLFKGDITFHDPDFHKKELTLMGSRNATREDFEYVLSCMRSGEIDTDTFITHRVEFDQLIEQFETYLDPKQQVIKAMVAL